MMWQQKKSKSGVTSTGSSAELAHYNPVHFIQTITRGEVVKVINTGPYGKPPFKFREVAAIYRNGNSSIKRDCLNFPPSRNLRETNVSQSRSCDGITHGYDTSELKHSPLNVDHKIDNIHHACDDYYSDDDISNGLTLRELQKMCKAKLRKIGPPSCFKSSLRSDQNNDNIDVMNVSTNFQDYSHLEDPPKKRNCAFIESHEDDSDLETLGSWTAKVSKKFKAKMSSAPTDSNYSMKVQIKRECPSPNKDEMMNGINDSCISYSDYPMKAQIKKEFPSFDENEVIRVRDDNFTSDCSVSLGFSDQPPEVAMGTNIVDSLGGEPSMGTNIAIDCLTSKLPSEAGEVPELAPPIASGASSFHYFERINSEEESQSEVLQSLGDYAVRTNIVDSLGGERGMGTNISIDCLVSKIPCEAGEAPELAPQIASGASSLHCFERINFEEESQSEVLQSLGDYTVRTNIGDSLGGEPGMGTNISIDCLVSKIPCEVGEAPELAPQIASGASSFDCSECINFEEEIQSEALQSSGDCVMILEREASPSIDRSTAVAVSSLNCSLSQEEHPCEVLQRSGDCAIILEQEDSLALDVDTTKTAGSESCGLSQEEYECEMLYSSGDCARILERGSSLQMNGVTETDSSESFNLPQKEHQSEVLQRTVDCAVFLEREASVSIVQGLTETSGSERCYLPQEEHKCHILQSSGVCAGILEREDSLSMDQSTTKSIYSEGCNLPQEEHQFEMLKSSGDCAVILEREASHQYEMLQSSGDCAMILEREASGDCAGILEREDSLSMDQNTAKSIYSEGCNLPQEVHQFEMLQSSGDCAVILERKASHSVDRGTAETVDLDHQSVDYQPSCSQEGSFHSSTDVGYTFEEFCRSIDALGVESFGLKPCDSKLWRSSKELFEKYLNEKLNLPPTKLFSGRKAISPTSQEKLCQAVVAKDDPNRRKRIYFRKANDDKTAPTEAGMENFESSSDSINKLSKSASSSSPSKCSSPHKEDNSPTSSEFHKINSGPSTLKGILKSSSPSSVASYACSLCDSVGLEAKKAIAFSQRQMHDIESLTMKLVKELKSMRNIVESLLPEEWPDLSSKHIYNGMKNATFNASETEETARKWLSMMSKDCNRFCKIMRSRERKGAPINGYHKVQKRITFADEAGGKLCHVRVFEDYPFDDL
ncbi:hypothetical protein AMTRI_Chr08g159800 [Amborella trichopoda]